EAGRWVEEAQITEERPGLLVATAAPPAPYAESIIVETRPGPDYTWIHGHWAWHGHWVWEHGHWHVSRPRHWYVQGRWAARGGQRGGGGGGGIKEAEAREERPGLLVASMEPPPAHVETQIVELRPSPSHVWIAGHWAWHGHWVWEHGHWHPGREGHTWVGGRWE